MCWQPAVQVRVDQQHAPAAAREREREVRRRRGLAIAGQRAGHDDGADGAVLARERDVGLEAAVRRVDDAEQRAAAHQRRVHDIALPAAVGARGAREPGGQPQADAGQPRRRHADGAAAAQRGDEREHGQPGGGAHIVAAAHGAVHPRAEQRAGDAEREAGRGRAEQVEQRVRSHRPPRHDRRVDDAHARVFDRLRDLRLLQPRLEQDVDLLEHLGLAHQPRELDLAVRDVA